MPPLTEAVPDAESSFIERAAASVARGTALTLSSWAPVGTNVFDRDWDLLIVFDTCRPDAMRAVADEYDFLSAIKTVTSVASITYEWTAATFTERHGETIEQTGFISANGWPERVLNGSRPAAHFNAGWAPTLRETVDESRLGAHMPAWRYGDGRGGESYLPQAGADTVVDLTIDLGRRRSFDRLITHVIEPHYPFPSATAARNGDQLSQSEQDPWTFVRNGGDPSVVWDNYLTELRAGLDAVERLLKNIDANRVLLTADHGERFGEWGRWGHTAGSFNPALRRVPLVTTTATDEETSSPTIGTPDKDLDVRDNLESLGYV